MGARSNVDRSFLIVTLLLLLFGLGIFVSASLGLLVRDGANFTWVLAKQLLIGVVGGLLALFVASKINYKVWKQYAFLIFILSLIATLLVFIPGVGLELGGAKRWINLGPLSFQPAEFLKFGFVLYFSAWLSAVRDKIKDLKYGTLPMLVMFGLIGALLLAQPNTGLFVVIVITGLTMFFIAGGRFAHFVIIALIMLLGIAGLAVARPYVKDRLLTFITPNLVDPLNEGYQIRQSLIAIGSGGVSGRGLGQSIQKFNYLPEPIGDSIFAVWGEESGFIGSFLLILLFFLFALLGFKIAARAPDSFSRLFVLGIVILVVSQSFLNIGAMLGVFPLSGVPILFVSQGGTALLFTLLEVGIILNISKYQH
ncbi:stage V sporulation protein E [bacterium]|nr:stage V sporulation protein E [bacterium]|tara:strand:+ start:5322 stop:6422 length:1101 start_codon:yes stop_codon:yes gene_type:complete